MIIPNSSYSFFQAVKKGTVISLDQSYYIESIDPDKLKQLKSDFEKFYLDYLDEIKDKFGMEKRLLDGSRPKYSFQTKNPRNVKLRLVPPEEVYKEEISNLDLFKNKIEDYVGDEKIQKRIKKKSEENKSLKEDNESLETAPEIDLSNSTCTEKIVYFKELGILDLLLSKSPFDTSVNKLAKALVPITGEKYGTIQPVLNSVVRDNPTKNNPYYNTNRDRVSKVREHLIELGVKFSEDKS